MELEKYFTKKDLARLLKEAWEDHTTLIEWLYDNHKEILREWEDKYHKGYRIAFIGGKQNAKARKDEKR